ncbi:FTR1 family protein [Ancylothrix sp. C2]|uniref:FTR1 family iron permease n=1 Tax=Ancylothrix sp. D3o TaxID=2953691 RepID=UPI0021BB280A|nr:FTR1 family protein [Ancylothrix sp. D3o]MCT7949489.1 FTR1 family protein [Ancylothrix sp. D3o]
MDFTSALPTFAIALREGVEAALVVGIVLACLKKANASRLNNWVYTGIFAGIAASVIVGLIFSWLMQILSHSNQFYAPLIKPLLAASLSVVAIGMLSWMLIWMTQQAKTLKTEIEGAVSAALSDSKMAAGWGVFTLIFIAVLREGFETVLFIFARFQQGLVPAFGAFAGIFVAAIIGALLFKWGVKINLRLFFQIMGIFLLLIVSGLVVSALKNFDLAAATFSQLNPDSSLCFSRNSCILGPKVWDATGFLPDNEFPGVILKALFGYRSKLYLLQFIAYFSFLATAGSIYFKSLSNPSLTAKTTLTKETSS